MTTKRSGLGRNLSALLGPIKDNLILENDAPTSSDRLNLSVDCLQPGKYQPRGAIEPEPLDELAASIKQQGILQPLIVRALAPGHYEIIAGERRWRACQLIGLQEVPVVVRQVDDETAMAIALVENLQREDLNVMDQARAMQRLAEEFDLTHQQVADVLGKSRTVVSNYLRLLSLTPLVRQFLEHGDLDMGHARSLLMLNEAQQTQAANLVVAKQLSVRETEKLVTRIKNGKPAAIAANEISVNLQQQVQKLAQQLQTNVKLKPGKAGKGSLTIHYNTLQNLQKLMEQLLK